MLTKRVENPRYSNDYHTAIAFEAVFVDENDGEVKRTLTEVNDDTDRFHDIYREFGDTVLRDNKQAFLEERAHLERERRNEKKNRSDHELFDYKTSLFDYSFVHNSSNRKLRRQIRRAQTMEEARLAACALFIHEVFGIEPQNDNINELLNKISEQ